MGTGWPVLRRDAHGEADSLRRGSLNPSPALQMARNRASSSQEPGSRRWGHVCPRRPRLSAQGGASGSSPPMFPGGKRRQTAKQSARLTEKQIKRRPRPRGCRAGATRPGSAAEAGAEGARMRGAERDPRAGGHTTSDHRAESAPRAPRVCCSRRTGEWESPLGAGKGASEPQGAKRPSPRGSRAQSRQSRSVAHRGLAVS